MPKTEEWRVCGRHIGAATGWDQTDHFEIQLYNFVPVAGYRGPQPKDGTINISFERGWIESFDDKGKLVEQIDLVTAIMDCEPDHPQ